MLKFFLFLFFMYAAFVFLLFLRQRDLIYFPNTQSSTPTRAGVPEMEVVSLQTKDGLTLKSWYAPPRQPHLPTIIYFHGNAGNIGHRGAIVKPFLNAGFGVLLLTYRGYSGNPGKPTEEGLYQDGRAAIQFLRDKNIDLPCVVLYGESIGTAVAIQLATEFPIGALVLQSPFTSLGEVGQYHYPFFPIKWLIKDQFRSIEKVNKVHVPTLVLYGKNDTIIPPQFSHELYDAVPSVKHIQPLPNVGHNDLYDSTYAIQFIKNYVKC